MVTKKAKPKKAKKTVKKASKKKSPDQDVIGQIQTEAKSIHSKILRRQTPSMRFPIRSLANVIYRPNKGYFQIKGRKKERTLTVGTVKTFAQTLRMMAFSQRAGRHRRHRDQARGLLCQQELGRSPVQ